MKWPILLLAAVLAGQTMPVEKERALARAVAEEAHRRLSAYAHPEAEAFLQRTGARLAPEISFRLVRADGADPVALPTGEVLVPITTFLTSETEAAFAGRLAHAVGHIVRGHLMKSIKPGELRIVLAGLWINHHANHTKPPLALAAELETGEREAEEYAAALLARAGYDPGELTGAAPAPGQISSSEYLRLRDQLRYNPAPTLR
jgi:predicted Zn-dependent protease